MSKYIIDFVDHASQEEINQYFIEHNIVKLKEYNSFKNLFWVEANNVPPMTALTESIVDDEHEPLTLLSESFTVISDQEYGKIRTDGSFPMQTISQENPNDWWKYYSLYNPNLDEPTYTFNRKGSGITVYVLDSGVEVSHPDFAQADVHNLHSFNNDFQDKNGHGTAIASVIVGSTCGMTNATVKSVKIFDPDNSTLQSDLLTALDVVLQDHLSTGNTYNIVNISWSISKNTFVENKIRFLDSLGLRFVVSAGNSGEEIVNVTPAGMIEVTTIGSYNQFFKPSNFSNYVGESAISLTYDEVNTGPLNGWAPGEDIYIATTNGGYGTASGTSIAAGIHSGALAYLMSDQPEYYAILVQTDAYRGRALGRNSLLDLSEKYKVSSSSITTYGDSFRESTLSTTPLLQWYSFNSGGKFNVVIFNPREIETITLPEGLPEGIFLDGTGLLYGSIPMLTDEEPYKKYVIPLEIKHKDGQLETTVFYLIVKNPEIDLSNYSSEDQELNIMLSLAEVSCVSGGDHDFEQTIRCVDDCPAESITPNCNFAASGGQKQGQFFCVCEQEFN